MLRKKWLSFLVAVSMVAAMLPTTAFAEGDAVQVGSMTTVVETVTDENKPQNTEGEKPKVETSEEEKSNDEKSEVETSEEEKSEGDKSEGEVSEEEKSNDEKSEGETNEDKTPVETPVTPAPETTETTETPAPETPAANSIMLMNEAGDEGGEGKAGEAAEPQSLIATPDTFEDVLASASTGANISLVEGNYNIGNQQIDKAVSFFGAGMDKTIIVGSLTYAYEGGGNVNVKNLTLQAPEDNTTVEQAINLKKADGTVLTVENCKIVDYLYGISVNTQAKNCTLKASNLALDNVWCGVSVKGGDANNTLTNFTVAEGSTVDYATQDWGTEDGVTYDKGYCETNGSEPVQATKPNLANGEWPAPPSP